MATKSKAEQYFIGAINQLPKGMGGAPQDPQTSNLYWGFLEMARQMSEMQAQIASLERTIASLR